MLSERDFGVRLRIGKNKDRSSLGTGLKRKGDNTVTD